MNSKNESKFRANAFAKRLMIGISYLGIAVAVIMSTLMFGLGAGWDARWHDVKVSSIENVFEFLAISYLIVGLLLLAYMIIVRFGNSTLTAVVGLLFVILTVLQGRILIVSRPEKLPDWLLEYSTWFEVIVRFDLLIFIVSIMLLTVQVIYVFSCFRNRLRIFRWV